MKSKKNIKACLSSKNDSWATPNNIFNVLNNLYGPFVLDAAANAENSKCGGCFYGEDDFGGAINKDWYNYGKIWVNPPYSNLKEFLKKGYEESRKGSRVVMLIPSRTDTKGWHDFVMKAEQVLFVKGRIKFGNSKTSAPFPSAVVIFDPNFKPLKQVDTITFGK